MIRRGDIVITHGDGIVSKMIQKVTHSYWNHVAFVRNSMEVVEAGFTGVRINKINKLWTGDPKRAIVVRIKDISFCDMDRVVAYAESKIGHDYDFLLIWHLLWLYIFHLEGRVPSVDLEYAYNCVELILESLYKTMNYILVPGISFRNVSPGMIAGSDRVVPVAC